MVLYVRAMALVFGLAFSLSAQWDLPQVGEPAPDFCAMSIQTGDEVCLDDFSGKYLILVFGSYT